MTRAPSLTDRLLKLADVYCGATGMRRGAVSNRIFADGKRLDVIAGGRDLQTRSFERAVQWFSDNWPSGMPWPDGLERPAPQPIEAAQ